LLAARAITVAADKLVDEIRAEIPDRVVLMQGTNDLHSFANYQQFLLQRTLLEQVFEEARKGANQLSEQAAKPEEAAIESMAILTTAGVAIDAVAKLGSYFMSNYEIGGMSSLTPDTEQLVSAVAQRLCEAKKIVSLPAWRVPQVSDFSATIDNLARLVTEAEKQAEELSERAEIAKRGSSGDKEQLQKAAAAYEKGAALLRQAISKAEAFVAGLAVADPKGILLVTKIAQEKAVCNEMNNGSLALFLDVRAMIGGYYTKRNLWTFLGGMPFYAMGGVVVTYCLVNKDGEVKASGLIPIHRGYAAVDKVSDLIG
jgi:hypothetical protein